MEWIDVNERLPKTPIDKRGYLCKVKSAISDYPIYTVLKFLSINFQGEDASGMFKVTHWMPIPEFREE